MQHSLIDKKFWDGVTGAQARFIIPREIVKNAREVTIYITFLALTSAGVIEIEECDDPDFTGTWASIATITWSAASKCHKSSFTGVHKYVGIRTSTAIVGGNVNGTIVAD